MLKKQKLNQQLQRLCASELQLNIQENTPEKKIFYKPDDPAPTIAHEKILIICFDAIGDFILSTPALFQIKKIFAGSKIDLVVSPRNHDLAEAYNEFNTLWTLDLNSTDTRHLPSVISPNEQQLLSLMRDSKYPLIINLLNRPNLLALYKISKMLTSDSVYVTIDYLPKEESQVQFLKKIDSDYYKETTSLHFIDQMLEVLPKLSMTLGLPSTPETISKLPLLPKSPNTKNASSLDESRKKILFNPFGSQKGNTLSKLKTLLILRAFLKKTNTEVILFSSTAKKLFFLPKSPLLKIIESETILDAIQIIKKVDLVLTTDTSIMHIATALDKKLVVLRNNETWRNQFDPLSGNFKIIQVASKNISKISIPKIKNAINSLMAF